MRDFRLEIQESRATHDTMVVSHVGGVYDWRCTCGAGRHHDKEGSSDWETAAQQADDHETDMLIEALGLGKVEQVAAARDFRTEVINAILKSTMDWFNSGKSQPMPYDALADGLIKELGLCDMEQELSQVRSERDNALGGWDQEVRSITQLESERDDAKHAAKKARSALVTMREERERFEDLRLKVVMALCTEDDDEERTDEQIVARVRELVSGEMGMAQELDAERQAAASMERELAAIRQDMQTDGAEIERLIKARDDARYIAKQYHDQAEELDAALATASATLKLLYEAAGVSDSTEPEVVARDIQEMAEMAAKYVNNTIARAHSDQEH